MLTTERHAAADHRCGVREWCAAKGDAMQADADSARSEKATRVSEAARSASRATAWAGSAAGAVQKLAFGQQVDSVVSFGANGWEILKVSRSTPKFAPRMGPIGGGGTVFEAQLPAGVRFLGKMDGDAGTNFIARMDKGINTGYNTVQAASTVMRPVTIFLGASYSYAGQLAQDAEQLDLDTQERHKRAAYRATMVTGAEMAGGLGGRAVCAWVGGSLGTFLIPIPGVGTMIGTVTGGIVGGYGGAKIAGKTANTLVDRTVDSVGTGRIDDLRENVTELVEDVDQFCRDAIEDLAESCREVAEDVGQFCRDSIADISDSCREVAEDLGGFCREATENLGVFCRDAMEDLGQEMGDLVAPLRKLFFGHM